MSRWSIAGAWVLVAALATTLTWQIVSAADAQVSDPPPLKVAGPVATTADAAPTTVLGTTSSTTPPATSGPSSSISSASSTSSAPGTSPASSTPPSTAAAWASQAIPTPGGVVLVRYRVGEVVLSSASPAAGFAADVKKEGPPEVDVEFESDSAKFRVRAEWSEGAVSVETEADVD